MQTKIPASGTEISIYMTKTGKTACPAQEMYGADAVLPAG